jgi:hypothetical protein
VTTAMSPFPSPPLRRRAPLLRRGRALDGLSDLIDRIAPNRRAHVRAISSHCPYGRLPRANPPPGEVVSGQDVIKAVEALGSDSGKPTKTVTIVQSGVIE